MQGVRKGDRLDFTKARLVERHKAIELKKPSKSDLEKGKLLIAKLVSKMRKGRENLARERIVSSDLMDEVYFEALEFWRGEDLQTGLEGVAGSK